MNLRAPLHTLVEMHDHAFNSLRQDQMELLRIE